MVFLYAGMSVLLEHGFYARPNALVVGLWNVQEINATASQLSNAGNFVIGAQGQVLHARSHVMPFQVFKNLALLLAGRWLIDRELNQLIAAGHHLGHQR